MTLLIDMATLKSVTMEGKSSGTVDVSDALFAVNGPMALVHQVVTVLRSNQREAWAHTKDRSERRGGGKKPWRQKGTGRARHGSSRSPIWRKGGVTFGPHNVRSYTKTVPKKVRSRAVLQLLTAKQKNDQCSVLQQPKVDAPSTSAYATLFAQHVPTGSRLLVTGSNQPAIVQSVRNIPRTTVVHADVLNALDLAQSQYVIFTDDALAVLEERFGHSQAK